MNTHSHSPKALNVVVVASTEVSQARLMAQLTAMEGVTLQENRIWLRLEDGYKACQRQAPDVMIVEMGGRESDASLFIESLSNDDHNPVTVFALHHKLEPGVLLDTFRRGAKEVLEYPSDAQGLATALRRQWAIVNRGVSQHLQQAKGPVEAKVFTLFGAKGGCGVSTVAVNLAYELHQVSKAPVLLIDLDQVFNNTAVLMNIKPTHALGELSRLGSRGDPEADVLRQLICKHESGLDVIVGSKDAQDENEMLPMELFDKIIGKLKQQYRYIVLDLPTHVLDPYHEYLIEKSNEVLVVSGLEIPALYRTRQYLDLARQYLNESKCKLVINRWNLKAAYGISNHKLAEAFQYPVSYKLSNDWNLNVEANSLGCPLGAVNPKADLVKEIRAIALDLSGLGHGTAIAKRPEPLTKPSFWKRLFGRVPSTSPVQDLRREGFYALPEAVMIRGQS